MNYNTSAYAYRGGIDYRGPVERPLQYSGFQWKHLTYDKKRNFIVDHVNSCCNAFDAVAHDAYGSFCTECMSPIELRTVNLREGVTYEESTHTSINAKGNVVKVLTMTHYLFNRRQGRMGSFDKADLKIYNPKTGFMYSMLKSNEKKVGGVRNITTMFTAVQGDEFTETCVAERQKHLGFVLGITGLRHYAGLIPSLRYPKSFSLGLNTSEVAYRYKKLLDIDTKLFITKVCGGYSKYIVREMIKYAHEPRNKVFNILGSFAFLSKALGHDIAVRLFNTLGSDACSNSISILSLRTVGQENELIARYRALVEVVGKKKFVNLLLKADPQQVRMLTGDAARLWETIQRKAPEYVLSPVKTLKELHDVLSRDNMRIQQPNVTLEYTEEELKMNQVIGDYDFRLVKDTYELLDASTYMGGICAYGYRESVISKSLFILIAYRDNEPIACLGMNSDGNLFQITLSHNRPLSDNPSCLSAFRLWAEIRGVNLEEAYGCNDN